METVNKNLTVVVETKSRNSRRVLKVSVRKPRPKLPRVQTHKPRVKKQKQQYALEAPTKFEEPQLACDKYAELEKLCPKGRLTLQKQRRVFTTITETQAALFYMSSDWEKLRKFAVQKFGRKCMCCGESEGKICADHIKPLRRFWELRLEIANLQILCEACNIIKGNWSTIDFRRMDKYKRKKWLRTANFYEERLNQYAKQQLDLIQEGYTTKA